ncbi:MAG: carbohydrate ABC transporter permease [Caldilineaceae bacterium]|uniref:Carbohydrate ABC transporter permease n=1 Tax=Caldilineaceae bacterium SB0662_bin_9 TaxID=2605258 RepID=A0A6B1DST2_9CHLR|nr:carbohydrate ABC transporter permease [Caldilineaceae bacterium]MXZ23425.1 carbohydrate ABC transporter permease [Caldilineaceae bacterium SB0665_bin_21]MXZ40549.1 carbohydrate ABC transporter permease [Caldilineaceae bacterium SB0666_bin_21]MYA04279.1 carbohydrate ABC transporter permease [Caldilineaceae bacterium SB0664_bin_22]MYC61815.1 carbohydrate ABC transporter permease [Caldilineaceae bacterium SB0661_bin_34]MYD90759.1 carbohydrate ABC transporter permease [Caldilineaceae bacterium 
MTTSFGSMRTRRATRLWQAGFYAVMITMSVVTVVPFLFMASTSFTKSFTMMTYPPTLIPDNPSLDNYVEIIFRFQKGLFPRWFFNTVFTTTLITAGSLLLNTLSGYIFAKKEFYGRDLVFALLLATMMVPVAVVLLPSFQIIRVFRLFNTYWALIIPALATPFGIFLMRQYITSLPTALIEVANIDGASELRIFWSIVIPLSTPGMAALGIFTVMNAWNAFLWPLIVLRANEMRTLVVGLATVQSEFNINYGLVMAGSVLTVLPLLVLYLIFQPYFVEGLRMGYGK